MNTFFALRRYIAFFACTCWFSMHSHGALLSNKSPIKTYENPDDLVIDKIRKDLDVIAQKDTVEIRRFALILKETKEKRYEKHLLFPQDTAYKGMHSIAKAYKFFQDPVPLTCQGHIALEVLFVWVKYNQQVFSKRTAVDLQANNANDNHNVKGSILPYEAVNVILPTNSYV